MTPGIRQGEAIYLIAVSLFFTIIDPYGATEALPRAWAFFYWLVTLTLGAVTGEAAFRILSGRYGHLSSHVIIGLPLLIASATVFGLILVVQNVLDDPVPASFFATLYLYVLLILAVLAGLGFLLLNYFAPKPAMVRGQVGDEDAERGDGAGVALFRDKLPSKFKMANILALRSDDHYLSVITDRGDTMIRMRLSDAMALLADLDGIHVHRSWWVARSAIEETHRKSSELSLQLSQGQTVPVSRSRRGDVDRWLARSAHDG